MFLSSCGEIQSSVSLLLHGHSKNDLFVLHFSRIIGFYPFYMRVPIAVK